jgi:hypothetical protein
MVQTPCPRLWQGAGWPGGMVYRQFGTNGFHSRVGPKNGLPVLVFEGYSEGSKR